MMTLQKAIDHVHVVVTSSHLPGWKENREAWSSIRKRLADITSTQQFVKMLDQLADQWAETEGETSPFVDQLRSQVAEFVTTVPTARASHLSQTQPVAQGYVSHDCDGDPVWSFANGESIYSIVQHPEGHQLVHTEGGELKLISKPFNLVAQGEAVAWQYRCITEEGPSPVWHMIDKETYDRWMETSWSRMEFRKLFTTPTIPTGYRVVPVEPTPEMLERAREVHAPLDGEDDDFDYEFTRTWKAMIAASPSAGGV